MKIIHLFSKPHPFIFNQFSVLIPAGITFFILLLLRPFEFTDFTSNQLIIWSLMVSFIVGLTVFLSGFLVRKIFHQAVEKWTLGKELALVMFVLAMISIEIFIFFLILDPTKSWFLLFWLVVIRTLVISIMPLVVVVLYEQNHHQKIKRLQAEQLNEELLKNQEMSNESQMDSLKPEKITLFAENQKVALHLPSDDIVFIKSEGNYVELHYHQNQKPQKTLIRNSLKSVTEQLPSTQFFRCHKGFVINIKHIRKVEGTARNLELIIDYFDFKIPVSRGKSEDLLQLFH